MTVACEVLSPIDHSRHGLERGACLSVHTRSNTSRAVLVLSTVAVFLAV